MSQRFTNRKSPLKNLPGGENMLGGLMIPLDELQRARPAPDVPHVRGFPLEHPFYIRRGDAISFSVARYGDGKRVSRWYHSRRRAVKRMEKMIEDWERFQNRHLPLTGPKR